MVQIGGGGGKTFDPGLLFELAKILEEEALDETWVTHALLAEVAEDESVPLMACYAAMNFAPDLKMRREHETSFEVCFAGCQSFGAGKLLRGLLAMNDERVRTGGTGFDVVPAGCLDDCDYGPIIKSHGPNGAFVYRKATPDGLAELVTTLVD